MRADPRSQNAGMNHDYPRSPTVLINNLRSRRESRTRRPRRRCPTEVGKSAGTGAGAASGSGSGDRRVRVDSPGR